LVVAGVQRVRACDFDSAILREKRQRIKMKLRAEVIPSGAREIASK